MLQVPPSESELVQAAADGATLDHACALLQAWWCPGDGNQYIPADYALSAWFGVASDAYTALAAIRSLLAIVAPASVSALAHMCLQEEKDEVKHMTQLVRHAKCMAVRDMQVQVRQMTLPGVELEFAERCICPYVSPHVASMRCQHDHQPCSRRTAAPPSASWRDFAGEARCSGG